MTVYAGFQKSKERSSTLVLFDVDGTLTKPRLSIQDDMIELLAQLKKKVIIGFVGGSDLAKQQEQLRDQALSLFDYGFSENGLTAYREGQLIHSGSFIEHLGEEKYQKLVGFILHYIADVKIPKKRGTFIEFRRGMINVSPVGRNCTYEERLEFEAFDKEHDIRKDLVKKLEKNFSEYHLKYSIGGQISIDIFPVGWDKTYCLRHVVNDAFDEIHFFGDKTFEGGNDFEIFHHPKVIGHSVTSPEDTARQIRELFPSISA